jgi:hypothetical protein
VTDHQLPTPEQLQRAAEPCADGVDTEAAGE